jgi:hypothetical protein
MHEEEKIRKRIHRQQNKKHKENELIRTRHYQKTADKFKKQSKLLSHKKIKGETMKTAIALNTRCSKEWSAYGNYKESFKTYCIWSIT